MTAAPISIKPLLFVAALAFVASLAWCTSRGTARPDADTMAASIAAVSQCKQFILQVSYPPSSVEWKEPQHWKTKQVDGMPHRWMVESSYYARLRDGSTRTATPTCVMDRDSQGGWTLVSPIPLLY